MCGRYSITLPPEAIREIFQTHGELPNWPAYYNAAPTTALPVVRKAKEGDGRELVLMTWGMIPWFSKDGKASFSTINARADRWEKRCGDAHAIFLLRFLLVRSPRL
jgi:putative SOS response-associated peptidase YedK